MTNDAIIWLNEVTVAITDKNHLDAADVRIITDVLGKILKKDGHYDADEIESWFENEGSWTSRAVRRQIRDIARSVQDARGRESRPAISGIDYAK